MPDVVIESESLEEKEGEDEEVDVVVVRPFVKSGS